MMLMLSSKMEEIFPVYYRLPSKEKPSQPVPLQVQTGPGVHYKLMLWENTSNLIPTAQGLGDTATTRLVHVSN